MDRIVLSTGGTGGHIFPALAVAEGIREAFPQVELLFVGSEHGPEGRLAGEAGIPFVGLPARGVLGRGLRSLGSAWWMVRSMVRCWRTYSRFRPHVVIGFGSYASFVPVLLATWKRIPTAVHEQNAYPGVTNRILSKRVQRVLLTFPDHQGWFDPQRVRVTGNPVRTNVIALPDKDKTYTHQTGHNILVLGGSQGAQAVNEAMVQALPRLVSQGAHILHQTGQKHYSRVWRQYEGYDSSQVQVVPFISNMAEAYAWSDLVVGRAGASTVAELTVVGRPSVLIPFPFAAHQHQLHNAKLLEKAGAALVVEQSYLPEVDLGDMILNILALPEKLVSMGRAARKLGQPGATRRIVQEMAELAGDKGKARS
ncbi:MAG: undecaprenyldiphospho-muramoylpentapeptide beta-N-acetylglucosaminyltransferase [Desulfovermiculus sp.]|nr:undecaprenyldiphospho-muramoylpentapeptide beta-N-acetylglucosaminyltransferase [Desulfovermiculus sp.]